MPPSTTGAKKAGAGTGATLKPVTRRYTINLHRRLVHVTGKKIAPRAIREIRKFAEREMKTKDVRIDTVLNRAIWSKGMRYPPFRVRVDIARIRNEDEDAAEPMYALVSLVTVDQKKIKGTQTEKIEGGADEETEA